MSVKTLACALLLVSAVSVQAQDDRPACRFFCGFNAELVVELGDDDEALVGPLPVVAVWGDRVFVSHQFDPERIQVFSLESGALIETIGSSGEGPEEFMRIGDLDVDSEGVLWVTDRMNQRITLIDARSGTFLTSFRVPYSLPLRSTTLLPDGTLLLNAAIPTRELMGFWLHRLHPTEGLVWSAVEGSAARPDPQSMQAVVAEDGASIWVAADTEEYALWRYGLDGTVQQSYLINREWFRNGIESEPMNPRNRDPESGTWSARSRILGIHSSGGRLWVLGTSRGDRWRRSLEERHGHVNFGQYFKSVLEIFDAETGQLLVSKDLSRDHTVFQALTNNGYAVAVRQTDVSYRLQLWRLTY